MKINFTQVKKLTFSQGTGLAMAAIVLITGLLICLLSWIELSNQLQQKSLQDAQRQLQRLAVTLTPSLLGQDRISLNITLKEWQLGEELYGLQVFNNNQQLLAENGRLPSHARDISQVITQDNLAIGSIRASLNPDTHQSITQRYLTLGLLATVLCALLAGLASWMLSEYFFAYLHRFANAVDEWQSMPNSELKLPPTPKLPQLAQLHHAFEHCAEQQLKHLDIEQAVEQFAGNAKTQALAAQYQSCALLFVEIDNLKELQKNLSASELINTLNRYYWLLVQAAKLYHGRLERYAGNGAVILFGTDKQKEAAANSLHCLYAAQLFLGLVDKEGTQNDLPFIDFRLAAHFGEVLLAPIADLEPGRYDLVGDTLHWAAHLANMSTEHKLLVSDAFHTQLSERHQVTWESGLEVQDLHGNRQKTWWLEALPEKQQKLINRQIAQLSTPNPL